MNADTPVEALGLEGLRLTELAEGWECAARLEDAIVVAYQPDPDPEFGEAANDYAASLFLFQPATDPTA